MSLFNRYITDLVAQKNIVPGTIVKKRLYLRKFETWFGSRAVNEITPARVNEYLIWLRGTGLKETSIFTEIGALKAFLNWCLEIEQIDMNPFDKIKLRKPQRRRRVVPPIHELRERLLAVCDNDRDRLIVQMFTRTGMRACEVARVEWEDLDVSPGELRIIGKGNKERFINISPEFAAILEKNRNGSKTIIPSVRDHTKGISISHLTHHMSMLYKRAGIKGASHVARASVATYLAEVDGIDGAQEQLGHASITTTMLYVRPNKERRRRRAKLLD